MRPMVPQGGGGIAACKQGGGGERRGPHHGGHWRGRQAGGEGEGASRGHGQVVRSEAAARVAPAMTMPRDSRNAAAREEGRPTPRSKKRPLNGDQSTRQGDGGSTRRLPLGRQRQSGVEPAATERAGRCVACFGLGCASCILSWCERCKLVQYNYMIIFRRVVPNFLLYFLRGYCAGNKDSSGYSRASSK